MCMTLGVSESGYYQWKRNSNKPSSRDALSVAIMEVLEENEYNRNYGVRRMQAALEKKGVKRSLGTIRDQMRKMGLLHRQRRPRGCTKASKEEKEAQNLVKQDFTAERPLEKVLTDISELECRDGKLYLAVIFDCFNGEILAMDLRDNMRKELCISLVLKLKESYGRQIKGMIVHSDRGAQYTSEEFRTLLQALGIRQSLCGEAHCYDNSRMESFWATLKKELIYNEPIYKMTQEEVNSLVFRYIYVYYNRIRLTSMNPDWLPPAAYRELVEEEENAKGDEQGGGNKAA